MARVALKIDVDTYRGTREGVPRLADVLERLDVRATFLFSVGPDHTGRAIRRVFRKGFVGKVRRTSVLRHYGVMTLLYGTLLPGPHIGRRGGAIMRSIAQRGFEVGVHTHDHSKWQDGVASAGEIWTRRELVRARAQFTEIFGWEPRVHGAAGWQINAHVPTLEHELGFRCASDVRGHGPFLPVTDGRACGVPQLPTTLPTLDELLGRADLPEKDAIAHLIALLSTQTRDQVFTLHAELEGGAYLGAFERVLRAWRDQGHELGDLGSQAARLDTRRLPLHEIALGTVAGRAGMLGVQGKRVLPPAAQSG